MARPDPLETYRAKRDFALTPEPAEGGIPNPDARAFVIQKHWARRLHYDLRLELDGSMKSWAVPKGPSLDPRDKRMAVPVEDHPISYNAFEGEIPPGQYGAGKVILWDTGVWVPLGDPHAGYRAGNLKFELRGHKLRGRWALIRIKGKGEKAPPWLLIKEQDAHARPAAEYSVTDALPDSVAALDPPIPQASGATGPDGGPKPRKSADVDPPAGAVKAALPGTLQPQLALLTETPPSDPQDWIYEIKFDGYRMLARIARGTVRLYTRNGHDWSAKLRDLVAALESMGLASAWLDGELVMLDSRGIPDFQLLQNAFDRAHTETLVYYLFDLPFHAGHDLRAVPLVERRRVLASLLENNRAPSLRLSEAFEGAPTEVRDSACRLGLEGVIGKRKRSVYRAARSGDWIKLKCSRRQEFVIGGYTDPNGSRPGIGALLVGVYDADGKLRYSGKVGTGFDHRSLEQLKARLEPLRRRTSPFAARTGVESSAHWVSPRLVAEVAFGEWTDAGRLRHATFRGLRTDKEPTSIIREGAAPAPPAALEVSHPGRVVDPLSGTTKLELVSFYATVAPLLMEHLEARPVALVRAPQGIGGPLFFQKHLENERVPGIRALDPRLDPGHAPLLQVVSPEGLTSAAQLNVIEFHTWNARSDKLARPDRITFDLDPGKGVGWAAMLEAATLVREFLIELGLVAFVKTSGGKGLHIVVPLQRRYSWDPVKGFAKAVVEHLAATLPNHFSATSGARNRVGKIFIDYLRNGFGATTAAAWSVRARPGLGVSVPVDWSELSSLVGGAHWTLATIDARLKTGNAPWADYAGAGQRLAPAMKRLGFKP